MEPKKLHVELIGWTKDGLGVGLYTWLTSRSNDVIPSPACLEKILNSKEPADCDYTKWQLRAGGISEKYLNTEFLKSELQMLLSDSVPVLECISLNFAIHNMPISLREQLVRHRVGTALDARVGADLIAMDSLPEQASSSFWSQTSRVLNLDSFFNEGSWYLPDSLEGKTCIIQNDEYEEVEVPAEKVYTGALTAVQDAYRRLAAAGVPLEDCRQLLPLATTHSLVWTLNLKSMMNVIGRRTCWISQASLWGELIEQMLRELTSKVSPLFSTLAAPPCVKRGKFVGCVVKGTNEDRIRGSDGDQPPCPLYARYHTKEAFDIAIANTKNLAWCPPYFAVTDTITSSMKDIRNWFHESETSAELLDSNVSRFSKLWHFYVFNPGLEVSK